MLEIIYGKKGSGKTKRIIDAAISAAEEHPGSIVFIAANNDYARTLPYNVRLVDGGSYDIGSGHDLYMFIQGMMAKDFDLDLIFIDGFLKIVKQPLHELEPFFTKLNEISVKNNIRFVMSVTGDEDTKPAFISDYII